MGPAAAAPRRVAAAASAALVPLLLLQRAGLRGLSGELPAGPLWARLLSALGALACLLALAPLGERAALRALTAARWALGLLCAAGLSLCGVAAQLQGQRWLAGSALVVLSAWLCVHLRASLLRARFFAALLCGLLLSLSLLLQAGAPAGPFASLGAMAALALLASRLGGPEAELPALAPLLLGGVPAETLPAWAAPLLAAPALAALLLPARLRGSLAAPLLVLGAGALLAAASGAPVLAQPVAQALLVGAVGSGLARLPTARALEATAR